MSDQKALKKRLKALMSRPENQVCSDCPEKKPTWASLIVPPAGVPPGSGKIGAFCCLECSGSHRRLGVHISFVRSVNLDSWKEDEVRSMESGGNSKVNAIFEARLAQSGKQKPTNLADGPTRERFIRDKYERRKFFNPAAYALPGNSGGAPQGGPSARRSDNAGDLGTPSDVARQRVANRQARMRPSHSTVAAPAPAPRAHVAAAPVSAPVDLLDFGFGSPAPTTTAPAFHDPFAAPFSSGASTPVASDPFAAAPVRAPVAPPQPPTPAPIEPSPAPMLGHEFLTPAAAKPQASNDSILALFSTPPPQTSFSGMQGSVPSNGNMAMGGNMMPQQQQMMKNQMNSGNNMTPQQQQMMMQKMMMHQQSMHGMNPQVRGMMNNQQQHQQQQQQQHQQGFPQNNNMMGMMNQQQQPQQKFNQNMMMQQGNPQMMQQGPPQMMGSGGMMNNNMNSMMQGMQQMNMVNPQQQQQQQMTGMGLVPPSGGDGGGFGAPMGGNAPTAQNDPFSTLGGMNAFR